MLVFSTCILHQCPQCTIPNVGLCYMLEFPATAASPLRKKTTLHLIFIKCSFHFFLRGGWLQNIQSLEGTNTTVAPLKKESLPVFHTSLVQHCVLEGSIVLIMKVEVLSALPPG